MEGVPRDQCSKKYSGPVWRVINGQAVSIAEQIDTRPDGPVPEIPGVPQRDAFCQQIIVTLAVLLKNDEFLRIEVRQSPSLRISGGCSNEPDPNAQEITACPFRSGQFHCDSLWAAS